MLDDRYDGPVGPPEGYKGMATLSERRARVNIVMRTRNRGLFLERAVDDVLGQRYVDWVLTIVNDGGHPDVVDAVVAARHEALANRVSVLHRSESSGMEAAANAGIRDHLAEFVAIHDDDDTWSPEFLGRTVAWLDAHPSDVAVAVRTEIVWEELVGSTLREMSREVFLPHLEQVTLSELLRFNTCVPISMLHRREALDAVGLFDETLDVVGDWECNLRLSMLGVIGFIPDRTLAYWHQRPGSIGDAGNSVIAMGADHRRTDRLIRDARLREYAGSDGLGLPLYMTRYVDDRFDELNLRLDRIEAAAGDTLFRRVKSMLRTLRRGS